MGQIVRESKFFRAISAHVLAYSIGLEFTAKGVMEELGAQGVPPGLSTVGMVLHLMGEDGDVRMGVPRRGFYTRSERPKAVVAPAPVEVPDPEGTGMFVKFTNDDGGSEPGKVYPVKGWNGLDGSIGVPCSGLYRFFSRADSIRRRIAILCDKDGNPTENPTPAPAQVPQVQALPLEEESAVRTFKSGDTVKATLSGSAWMDLPVGTKGQVVKASEIGSQPYKVEFVDGHVWWCDLDDISFDRPAEPVSEPVPAWAVRLESKLDALMKAWEVSL